MAGFFRSKKLSGTREKTPSAGRGRDAGQTSPAGLAAESQKHLKTIGSKEFAALPAGQRPQAQETGPWLIGKTVGEIYQIRGVLGHGGMGIVYLAFDTATHREVAVKVPLGKFFEDAELRRRIAREAEVWTGLIHPNMVHAFDVRDDQTSDYRPAIFMDYCDGGSLAERLRNRPPLSMPEALDIAIQVCWAMEFAHKKRLVHRDLKPGNVLLRTDGTALVSDFGLVKRLEPEDLEVTSSRHTDEDAKYHDSLTRGLVVGTPEYMPPEQWEGRACKKSDIYAFGIMLYELFCGVRPFSAPTRAALRLPHCKVPPPDPRRNAQIPEPLAEIMLACLAKEPSERPQSFGQITECLMGSYCAVAGKVHTTLRTKPLTGDVSRQEKRNQACARTRSGLGCMRRNDCQAAEKAFLEAQHAFKELDEPAGLGAIAVNLGELCRKMAKFSEAEQWLVKAEEIAKRIGHHLLLMGACNTLAVLYNDTGRFDEAESILTKTLKAFDAKMTTARSLDVSRLKVNLGWTCKNRGRLKEAEAAFSDALALTEVVRDETILIQCHLGLGAVAELRNDPHRATKMYERALISAETIGDFDSQAGCCYNIGYILLGQVRLEEAEKMFTRALQIDERLNNEALLRRDKLGLADLDLARRQFDRAIQRCTEVLKWAEASTDRDAVARAYFVMACVRMEESRYAPARECAQKSLDAAKYLKDLARMQKCYELMATASSWLKEGDRTAQYLAEAIRLSRNSGIPLTPETEGYARAMGVI